MTAEMVSAIAAAISATAALVSLLVAIVAVWTQAHAADPRIRVQTSTGFTTAGPMGGRPVFFVTAQNRGIVPVTIVSAGFDLSGEGTLIVPDPRGPNGERVIPERLEPGEALTVLLEIEDLARQHVERGIRRAFVSSAAGDRFTGDVNGRALATWAKPDGPRPGG